MALRGQDAYQLAGLLSQLPTLSGRPNSVGGMAPALFAMGQQARADAQRKQRQEQVQTLLGSAPKVDTMPQAGPMRPGEARPELTAMTQGSGLLGGQMAPAEFYGGLLGVEGMEELGMKGLLAQQGAGSDMPSNVREWQYFQTLAPEEQTRYLQMKRNPTYLDLGPQYVQPGIGGPTAIYQKDLAPAQRPEVQAQQEAAKTTAKAQAEAAFDAPRAIENAQQALGVIDKAISHPGRATATGKSSIADPRNYILGTDAYNYQVLSRQLQGKTFLEAYQSLKGGGQITEIEGQKAEDAIARLDLAQGDEEYLQALLDLRSIIERGMDRARKLASGANNAPPPPPGFQIVE